MDDFINNCCTFYFKSIFYSYISSIKWLNRKCLTHIRKPEEAESSTWQTPVCSGGPPVQHTAAGLLWLLDGCSSGLTLSDGRGWTSELRPEKHSLPLRPDNVTVCREPAEIRQTLTQSQHASNIIFNHMFMTDLSCSSLQSGLFSPTHSSSTPESFRGLVLRSRTLRLEELRTEDRAAQLLSDSSHLLRLERRNF